MEQLFNEKEIPTTDTQTTGAVEASSKDAADVTKVADDVSQAKFGEQLAQLEGIVTQLESGQLDLEDSLKRYEEGVQLIRLLQEKLSHAEQKVQVMMGEISPAE